MTPIRSPNGGAIFRSSKKNLAEQRRRLLEQMQSAGTENPAPRAEPLVWRNEDDTPPKRVIEPTAARKRNLARQTRRDRIVAVGLIILLVVVIAIGLWIAHALPSSA